MESPDRTRALDRVLSERGINSRRWHRRWSFAFQGVDFEGKRVLDIGSGSGWASCYAACHGAARVVSIEPEAAGGRSSMLSTAREVRERLLLEHVIEIVPSTFQAVELDEQFDVIVLHDSVNHLDESACIDLRESPQAKEAFRAIFEKIAVVAAPGADLILTDCSPRNFFNDIGLKSPVCPTIEWHKHQQPEVWAEMLTAAGFHNPQIAWTPHTLLGAIGPLLANRVCAYFVNTHFRLQMQRREQIPADSLVVSPLRLAR